MERIDEGSFTKRIYREHVGKVRRMGRPKN